MQYALKISIALLPVFLLFAFYFRHFIFERNALWQSKAFFYGLLSAICALPIQFMFPVNVPVWLRAFVQAAFVEEAVRFAFIYIRVHRSSETFTVLEGVFDGILIGLGFSFAENLLYSTKYDGFVILLRCVSSVPVHAFCGGMVGFFLSYRYHCDPGSGEPGLMNRMRRHHSMLAVSAIVIPTLYHGCYDYILFRGQSGAHQNWNYWLPILLLVGFFYVEYLIARGRIVLSRNVLELLGVDAEDMDIIQRQIEYEKWMAETLRNPAPPPKLFHNRWGRFNTVLGGLLLTLAVVSATLMYRYGSRPFGFDAGVSLQVQISLLVLLPLSVALFVMGSEKINYLFVRQQMLRLPRVTVVNLVDWWGKGGGQDPATRYDSATIALDVQRYGLFAAAVRHLEMGERVELEFGEGGKAVRRRGVVRWVNEEQANLPVGVVVRYTDFTTPAFLRYRLMYELSKLSGRLRHGLGRAR